jgi:ELWxxDGT repeat protein
MVEDIHPGAQFSNPSDLTALGGIVYFAAVDGSHGHELWRSDGTAAGTKMVRDIKPGGESVRGRSSFPFWLTAVDGTLFLEADDGMHGRKVWRSDGTRAGTKRVEDLEPGRGGNDPKELTAVDRSLYFSAADGRHGRELWRTSTVGCRHQPATIVGTEGDDALFGTSGGDVIAALRGEDMATGLAGKDTICGGRGRDVVLGARGADTLAGGKGRDQIKGARAADDLHSADGTEDLVKCGRGRDTAVVDRKDLVRSCEKVRVRKG